MAVIISDEVRQKFLNALFTDDQIDEIGDDATKLDVVETVANGAAFLRANNFLTARMIEIATQGTVAEAVHEAIHESAKLIRADISTPDIAALAINANSKADVQDYLRTAQAAHDANVNDESPGTKTELNGHLAALKERFCFQREPSIPAVSKAHGILQPALG